jgi:hypothetical protein
MTALPSPAAAGSRAAERARTKYFWAASAAFLLVLVFVGFRHFYLHGRAYPGRELPPPIRDLVITHGVSMTLWMFLLVVQPFLIVGKKPRVHMLLGWIGTALAALITVVGWKTGVASASVTPPEVRIWGLPPAQFMIVPVVSVVVFAAFVAIGVAARKRPEIHRPAMFLATLSALSAAVSRIDALNDLYLGSWAEAWFGPFFMTLVVGAVLVAVKCALARSFDRWFAGGFAALVLADVLIVRMAPSETWTAFAESLLASR